MHTFIFLGFHFLKSGSLSLSFQNEKHHKRTHINIHIKMSYNFGNDGATQFQGGGYGYARVYVLFASFLSLSLSMMCCASCRIYIKKRDFGEKKFLKKKCF